MNTRKMKLKIFAKTLAVQVGKFFFAGAAATNFFIAVRPDLAYSRTCEAAQKGKKLDGLEMLDAIFIADMGIYVFITAGSIRGIVIPIGHWALEELYSCHIQSSSVKFISKNNLHCLEKLEYAAITSINIYSFMQIIPLENKIFNNFISIFCGIPLFSFISKKINKNLPASTNEKINSIFSRYEQWSNFISQGITELGIVTTTAVSARAVAEWMLNWFYNSTHLDDWSEKDYVLNFTLASFALFGLALVLQEKKSINSALKKSVFYIDTFMILTDVIASIYFCSNVAAKDPNNFWKNNLFPFLFICFSSLIGTWFQSLELDTTIKNDMQSGIFWESDNQQSAEEFLYSKHPLTTSVSEIGIFPKIKEKQRTQLSIQQISEDSPLISPGDQTDYRSYDESEEISGLINFSRRIE